MNKTEKMTKEQLLQYVQQLQQAAAQAEAAAAAAEQRAEQAEQRAEAAKAKRAPKTPKTHADLLAGDPAYLAGAIWRHVSNANLSATEEGALNALVTHAYKGGKLMSAGASRQNLSRARRAIRGYIAEGLEAAAHDVVFDCLYCVPCITVSPEGDYMGYSQVLSKSPRLLRESLEAAETKLAAASKELAAAEDKDTAKAEKAVSGASTEKDKAKAQLDAVERDFALWLQNQKAAIAAATTDKDNEGKDNEGKDKAEDAS